MTGSRYAYSRTFTLRPARLSDNYSGITLDLSHWRIDSDRVTAIPSADVTSVKSRDDDPVIVLSRTQFPKGDRTDDTVSFGRLRYGGDHGHGPE